MLINEQGPRKLRAPMTDLVLLPGFMCDADLWTDMAPDLARIGHIHYGNVYKDDTLEGMAERVLEGSPEKFILIGFSMGGFVARVLTLAAPERIIGVAFVASSARGYSAEERARRQAGWQPGNRPPRTNGVAAGLHPDRERDPLLLERLRGMQRRLGPDVRARQSALVRNDGKKFGLCVFQIQSTVNRRRIFHLGNDFWRYKASKIDCVESDFQKLIEVLYFNLSWYEFIDSLHGVSRTFNNLHQYSVYVRG